jgi:hypothetical protein
LGICGIAVAHADIIIINPNVNPNALIILKSDRMTLPPLINIYPLETASSMNEGYYYIDKDSLFEE